MKRLEQKKPPEFSTSINCGEIYFCIQDSLNELPTNTDYWVKVGLRGQTGEYDLGVTYRGYWDYYAEYRKYDLISYNNNLYVARRNNIHAQPIPLEIPYLNDNTQLNDDLYLENPDPHPKREMHFLNNSLFLGDNVYIRNNWADDSWFLLTHTGNPLQIYYSPEDYSRLPLYSIFFQKL